MVLINTINIWRKSLTNTQNAAVGLKNDWYLFTLYKWKSTQHVVVACDEEHCDLNLHICQCVVQKYYNYAVWPLNTELYDQTNDRKLYTVLACEEKSNEYIFPPQKYS